MSFDNLNLIHPLKRALSEQGYTTPTPIQNLSIPHLLNGKDMIGIAQTGTGKTAAFSLPILQNMSASYKSPRPGKPRVLVLAPTRELAAQIGKSFETYGQFTRFKHTVVFGGVGQSPQVRALSKGVDILVATPGRLLDLMDQGHVRLSGVEYFVLDEADRMLDMGFINDVYKIVDQLPKKRQSLFYSATMSPEISALAKKLLTNPVTVEVTPQATTVELIDQYVFFVDSDDKNELLLQLMRSKHLECVLVFTRTKHRANKVAQTLNKNKIPTDAIHGNKSQTHRTKALHDFRTGKLRVLVATDIAARGIDIPDISHVINYDLPNISESYVHRIGRTARAGAEGTAYSFCGADERDFLRGIEKLTRTKIDIAEHEYHSEKAKNATGDAAKPAPRQQRGQKNPRGSSKPRGTGRGKKAEGKASKNKPVHSGAKKSQDKSVKKVSSNAGNKSSTKTTTKRITKTGTKNHSSSRSSGQSRSRQ